MSNAWAQTLLPTANCQMVGPKHHLLHPLKNTPTIYHGQSLIPPPSHIVIILACKYSWQWWKLWMVGPQTPFSIPFKFKWLTPKKYFQTPKRHDWPQHHFRKPKKSHKLSPKDNFSKFLGSLYDCACHNLFSIFQIVTMSSKYQINID